MPRLLKVGGLSAVGFLALLAAWNVPVQSTLGYTCVICRLERWDSTLFHFTRSAYNPTECSRWYAEHVEPSHGHVWQRRSCEVRKTLLGMRVGFACGYGSPIHLLPSDAQMRAHQHFENPFEAKRLFEGLAIAKTRDGRVDGRALDHVGIAVEALSAWEIRGLPGDWDEWWAGFLARPPE
jgi:hypothetical protein